ncbi:MAG: nucleoside deaminase [Candidatus Omnitrophota bacterium]
MITEIDKKFMRLAMARTVAGIKAGQTPFGACIVTADGRVAACEHNVVWEMTDITAHGEVTTIRAACQALGAIDLSGCTIYSTTEPCPMCFSAIHWARIRRIVYGASIADAQKAGFNELTIANTLMKQAGGSPVEIEGGCLREECVALFTQWKDAGQARLY